MVALVLLVVLAGKYGDIWRIVTLSIYGSTLFFLYLASTLYHAFTYQPLKSFFRILDHSSIYLLIAGTYTPISLVFMRGPWGWTIFGLIWVMAIGGIMAKIFLIGKYKIVSVFFYVAMGWFIVIAYKPVVQMVPKGLIVWLFIGGLCYTLGLIFYAVKKVPYFHFIWHLFVLGGSISHFLGMLLYLTSTKY